jgi:hypothetical protein
LFQVCFSRRLRPHFAGTSRVFALRLTVSRAVYSTLDRSTPNGEQARQEISRFWKQIQGQNGLTLNSPSKSLNLPVNVGNRPADSRMTRDKRLSIERSRVTGYQDGRLPNLQGTAFASEAKLASTPGGCSQVDPLLCLWSLNESDLFWFFEAGWNRFVSRARITLCILPIVQNSSLCRRRE